MRPRSRGERAMRKFLAVLAREGLDITSHGEAAYRT